MNRKLMLSMGLTLILGLTLGGCGPAGPQTVEVTRIVAGTPVVEQVVVTATPEPEGTFRVAVVMPCGTTDMGWCQALAEALGNLQEEAGGEAAMEVAYSEYMWNPVDAATAMRDYAAGGYDLVIAHSTTLSTAVEEVAREFPDTSFAWGTGRDPFQRKGIYNVFTYDAPGAEPGYVLGVMAGLMTQTGKLGIVGAVEGGEALKQHAGFILGAQSVNPDVEVFKTYTGDYNDVSKSTAAAESHIQNGADIMMGEGAQMGPVSAAQAAGVYYFATAWDHTPLAPEAVPVSQIYKWDNTFGDIMASIKMGVSGGKSYILSFANDGYELIFSDGVDIPEDVRAAVDATLAGILDGSIVVEIPGGS